MLRKKSQGAKHFKHEPFLKALGLHCQKLRSQKGLSIDRLTKESEQLSSSVVHRLENGLGAVTVSAIYRYAQALRIPPKDFLDFEMPTENSKEDVVQLEKSLPRLLDLNDPHVTKRAFQTLLPVYSLKVAVNQLRDSGYLTASEPQNPDAWIEVPSKKEKFDSKFFVIRVFGNSMSPKIKDGDYSVFRLVASGNHQNKIVLAQYRGPIDPDTGSNYTVRLFHSSRVASDGGSSERKQIQLSPLNLGYEPMILFPKEESDFRIIAEYVFTV